MKSDYLEFRRHEGELQPSIRTKIGFRGLTSPFGVVSHCPYHCCARVARGIRGIQTYRSPLPPPSFPGSLYIVLIPLIEMLANINVGLVRCLT